VVERPDIRPNLERFLEWTNVELDRFEGREEMSSAEWAEKYGLQSQHELAVLLLALLSDEAKTS
jgi:hypothetical protein